MKQTLTTSQLSHHLEKLKNEAQAIPLNQLLNIQAISCVDGRNFAGVVAAPGGNAGLFLQMLASYELHSKQELTKEQITTLFNAYLNRFGHFYMHSDSHALNAMVNYLKSNAAPISSLEQLISYLSAPAGPLKSVLLDLLSKPKYVGCGHIRLMLENAVSYRVRTEIITAFMNEFFLRFWAGDDRLQFEILEGDHAEQAILNIHISEKKDLDNTPLALIAPQLQDIQVFINHPEATAFMHRQHAEFLTSQGLLDASEQAEFTKVHAAVHTAQLTATVQALGAGLPVFDVVMDEALTIQQVELVN